MFNACTPAKITLNTVLIQKSVSLDNAIETTDFGINVDLKLYASQPKTNPLLQKLINVHH